jgi:hypothetical protein
MGTKQLHIDCWWSKSTLPNTMLQLLNYFLFLQLKCVLKGQFVSTESHCKSNESTDRGIGKCFLECFQKQYEHWQSVSLLNGTTLKETAFGTPSTCNFGWCFLLSLLKFFKYTTCFSLMGHLHVYNLVCRSSMVTATAAGSFLGWHCGAMHNMMADHKAD